MINVYTSVETGKKILIDKQDEKTNFSCTHIRWRTPVVTDQQDVALHILQAFRNSTVLNQ